MRSGLGALGAVVVVAACSRPAPPPPPPPAPPQVTAETAIAAIEAKVAVRSRYELDFALPGVSVHPDDVLIQARFTAPSGKGITVGGFPSHDRFVVRFTPREDGPYTFVVRADPGSGMREVRRGTLVATPSDVRGFTRADDLHRRFVDEHGQTVLVLGENRINVYDPSWNYGSVGIAEYLRRMKESGMTAVRVFILSDCKNEVAPDKYQIGCLEKGIGRFDERTADAFDVLFDAAEKNDIDVILVAFAIGYTPLPDTWKSWADNPYSIYRGGPATAPSEFFGRRFWPDAERKLRYIADRWASSPRLLAIDLLNEPEWDGPIAESVWIPWAVAMAHAWRALDPYGHLVTAGPVGPQHNVDQDETAWYANDANDIVQWHLYGKEFYDPYALALEMERKVEETWRFGKPIVCGEFAYGGEDKSTYDHTHNGIWSLLLSGAGALAHSAPVFQIDSDEPMTPERAAHFRVLSDVLRSLDRSKVFVPQRDMKLWDREAHAMSLVASDGDRLLWLLGPRRTYGSVVKRAKVTLRAPPAGRWGVTWIDDVTGKELGRKTITSPGDGDLSLEAPPFVRHVAGRIVPQP
jgi:hypothetical protein